MEDQKPELLDLYPRVGNPVLDGLLLGDEGALHFPGQDPFAHHVQGALRCTDRPHAVVDPSPP